MKTVTEKFLETVRKFQMMPEGAKVLCAVSGGADSVCLLHLICSHRKDLGVEVACAHFEHGIRGEESLRDARFVEELCRSFKIECLTEHGNVPEYAKTHSMGDEEAARILRYEFLGRAANKLGCSVIATAHNSDDNAETVLYNLTRGSGSTGLCGIPVTRGNIIRPLISVSREEIESYLSQNNLPHVEDSTNASDEYSRNMIRHNVVPVLKRINARFPDAVFRTSELMRRDEDYLAKTAEDFISANCRDNSLDLGKFKLLHPAVSSRVVRQMSGKSLSCENVDDIMKLIHSSDHESKTIVIPGMRVTASCGKLIFEKTEEKQSPKWESFRLVPGKSYLLQGSGRVLRSEITICPGEVYGLLTNFYLKYDEIKDDLWCTPRQAGDQLRPAGRNCTKSLKQLFLEKRVPSPEREFIPVLRSGKKIAAVAGIAVSEEFIAKQGEKSLHIIIDPEN